ncbi:MAG: aminotransferase class V-fold PLP-dependent enzyme [Usitatibacter sp.]
MLASQFSRFRDANPGRLHFAAHSHHPWPDVTEAAHARYWTDSATLADRKWERVLGVMLPRAQDHVARLLQLSDARQVAFAPNTHEFVTRLYSCLEGEGPFRVLTTAHEFHSFRRQTRRLQESGRLIVEEIPGEPWNTFTQRFIQAARSSAWDMVFLSHVFFDSGYVVQDVEGIVAAAPANALVAIDGYHAFCALPVDLARIHRRAFYLAGGYKYAMSGEGCCFLAIPPGTQLRPSHTGWFASFDSLAGAPAAVVPYAGDAFRFWGSTFDPSGLYRFDAAMAWLASTGTTIEDIHRHSAGLQKLFLDGLSRLGLSELTPAHLVPAAGVARGNFLAFDLDHAEDRHERIAAQGVTIDRRGRRLRFGFGVYHDESQVSRLIEVLSRTLT